MALKVIAIDGPAGSGKSTIARNIAKELGFLYIDTGAMYRALTLKALKENLNFEDKKALVELSGRTAIELKENGDALKVLLDRKDVTEEIRTMEVTSCVRRLSPIKGVRDNMVRLQRKLGESGKGAVLEGRDIGTVVFPDAKYKFYLDASFDTRVDRRYKELKEKGQNISREEIAEDAAARDESDMTRKVGPLKKAEDALLVNTTGMTIAQVTDTVLKAVGGLKS